MMNPDAQQPNEEERELAHGLHAKGVQALEHDNHDYAMDLFEAALAADPAALETRALLHAARVKRAKEHPATALKKAGAASALLKQSALLKKDPIKALQAADKLLRIDPFQPRFLRAHRDASFAANLPEAALQTLRQTTDALPGNAAILETLRETHRLVGDVQGEYDCLSALVKLNPTNRERSQMLKETAARLALERPEWSAS